MFFGDKHHLVGLDIGSSTVKVAEIVTSKKGRMLKHFGVLPLNVGAVEDGVLRDPDHVASVIRNLFSQHKVRTEKVALSIGGYSAIVKKIHMPVMDEESLQKSILVEAEQYIPFDIKDIRMDFQVMGTSENNSNQLNILLVAAKKDLVTQYVDVVELADLLPVVVDVDAFAVQNVHEMIHGSLAEEVVLLHVGASKMSLNIVKGGDSIFMRDVSLGSRQINSKIRARTGCSEEEAEALKLSGGGTQLSTSDYEILVGEVVGQWCTEIGRAMDFFYSTYPGERVEKIVLSGGGAHVASFVEALALQTGSDVSVLDPFASLEMEESGLDEESVRRIGPQAAVCIGLALRRVEDK